MLYGTNYINSNILTAEQCFYEPQLYKYNLTGELIIHVSNIPYLVRLSGSSIQWKTNNHPGIKDTSLK